MILDIIYFYSSFWITTTTAFKGIPLNVIQLNWNLTCRPKGLK